jgi:hypothetical protein
MTRHYWQHLIQLSPSMNKSSQILSGWRLSPRVHRSAAMAGPSNLPHPESIGRRTWCKHAYEMKGEKEFRKMMPARLVSAWDAIPDAAVHSPSDISFMK